MVFYYLISILLLFPLSIIAQTSEQKIDIVQSYLDAAFQKDIETQRSHMSEQIIDYHPTILAAPAKGIDELLMGWNNTMQPLDSVNYERTGSGLVRLTDGVLYGEWVLETGMVHMKFPNTKEWIKMQMVGLYKIEKGKIIEVRNFGNMMDLYQQMGYTLTPPGK